jgi:L-threonylcarbamoyladenylate synthase
MATSNLQTVALRVPSHPVALSLLKTYEKPIAAPSANLSGTVSATNANHVFDDFGDNIEMILDGDKCPHGIESTIVDVRSENIQILREGAITKDQIFKITNLELDDYDGHKILSPGQLEKHYSPRARVRINVKKPNADEYFITFGQKNNNHINTINLSSTGDLHEFAHRLYACLRDLDNMNIKKIAISPIPDQGIGRAINDRIKRASK